MYYVTDRLMAAFKGGSPSNCEYRTIVDWAKKFMDGNKSDSISSIKLS
jgi:hypothetical protein